MLSLVEQRTENPRVGGSIPPLGIFYEEYMAVLKNIGRKNSAPSVEKSPIYLPLYRYCCGISAIGQTLGEVTRSGYEIYNEKVAGLNAKDIQEKTERFGSIS